MRTARWLVAPVLLLGLLGCGHEKSPSTVGVSSEPPEVSVAVPARKTLRYIVEQPGRIEPFEQTPIYARISGYVRTVSGEIGQEVKRGHSLAELDVPELVQEHRRKEALVTQARLGILQAEHGERVAEASIVSAKAQIAVARAAQAKSVASLERWKSEFERMERLVKDSVVDKQSRDEMRSQVRAAEAAKREADAHITATESALAEAQARRDKAQVDRDAARNQLVVAQADEQQAKAMLDYSRITAPYDGVIADRRVHTGHYLPAATGSTTGSPLFVIVRMDKVRVFVEVPEADAVRMRNGNAGIIQVQALNDREFVGKVAGTSWSLDPSQRTLRTEIDFQNDKRMLRPGMYVHARIEVERPDSWVIPAGAVLVRDGESFCYQVRDGKTHRLPLRVGMRNGDLVEVLKFQAPPASPGDRLRWVNPSGDEAIVVSKPGELIDNQSVQVTSDSAPR